MYEVEIEGGFCNSDEGGGFHGHDFRTCFSHQLPTIPWLDSVEYLVSQVLKKVHINVVWIPSEEDISMWKKI